MLLSRVRVWVSIGVVAVVLLAGCVPGGSGRARADATKLGDRARAEAVSAFNSVARGVEATRFGSSGTASWGGCADLLGKQVSYTARHAIVGTNVLAADYPRLIERSVRSEGWDVVDSGYSLIMAKKDGLELSVEYGRAAMNLTLRTDCVSVTRSVVAELSGEPLEKLGLVPPAKPLR